MRSSHRREQKRGFRPHSFANQTAAFLKYFQVLTQTAQVDLLAERLPQDNHAIYFKIFKEFSFLFFAAVTSKEEGGPFSEHKSTSDWGKWKDKFTVKQKVA